MELVDDTIVADDDTEEVVVTPVATNLAPQIPLTVEAEFNCAFM